MKEVTNIAKSLELSRSFTWTVRDFFNDTDNFIVNKIICQAGTYHNVFSKYITLFDDVW